MAKGCVATLTEFSVIVVAFKLVNPVIVLAKAKVTVSCADTVAVIWFDVPAKVTNYGRGRYT